LHRTWHVHQPNAWGYNWATLFRNLTLHVGGVWKLRQ
jgi:hypothetical protein